MNPADLVSKAKIENSVVLLKLVLGLLIAVVLLV